MTSACTARAEHGGVRRFTCADILARVPAWSQAVAEAALAELVAAGLVLYDPAARLLFACTSSITRR